MLPRSLGEVSLADSISSHALNLMQELLTQWEHHSDRRIYFLNCYRMMTENMVSAVQRGEFIDSRWVSEFIEHFAGYYFSALDAYQRAPSSAPAVWRVAHNAAQQTRILPLQLLLLGINAHINYDLALAVVDILAPDWERFSDLQRHERYRDYCYVNEIIARTIDVVQDEVLEPAMPVMDLLDKLLGPVDEHLIGMLIRNWRERVWRFAVQMLEAQDTKDRAGVVAQMEAEALQLASRINLGGF